MLQGQSLRPHPPFLDAAPDPSSLETFFSSTPDCIKLLSPDGALLKLNKAGRKALGIGEDAELGMRWLSILPLEVREAGANALACAAGGVISRFPGKSVNGDETRYWDNLLIPVPDAEGRLSHVLCMSRDVTEHRLLEEQLEAAAAHEALIAKEMQHRVKNVFAVVSGLLMMSEREAAAESGQVGDILGDKLSALARASDAALTYTSEPWTKGAVDLETVVAAALNPYGRRCVHMGEATTVRPELMTTIALVLHELATNAVKYGALGAAQGTVDVTWSHTDDELNLRWRETCDDGAVAQPSGSGFGSKMIDRIVQSGGGRITRQWRPEGLVVDIALLSGPH